MKKQENKQNRRDFIKSSSLATGGLLASTTAASGMPMNVFSGADDVIKIGVIGSGGRGTGAAVQALLTKANVRLVALADAFEDNVKTSRTNILKQEKVKDRVQVPDENLFWGFGAYKKVIDLVDVVLIATPPGFRPIHFKAAIDAGKHVFMEKPLAVDTEGIKSVLATAEEAKKKKLNVVVGLQRHYQKSYMEIMDRVHNGAIGDITSMSVYWNSAGVWVRPRKPHQNEMEFQMRNWYYFNWLCGDHIAEQHVHNIDVGNWAKQDYPVKALGMGGREVRTGSPNYGEIYDHFFIEFHYADGTIMNSQCRHMPGCVNNVSETIVGTEGTATSRGYIIKSYKKGKTLYKHDEKMDINPYQYEHDLLFEAITKGEYKYEDATNGAKSTMCAIIGRMAAYSGQEIKWDDAMTSGYSIMPKEELSWDAAPPILPNEKGEYPIAIPGKTRYVNKKE